MKKEKEERLTFNPKPKCYGNGCSFYDGDITTVFLQPPPFFQKCIETGNLLFSLD